MESIPSVEDSKAGFKFLSRTGWYGLSSNLQLKNNSFIVMMTIMESAFSVLHCLTTWLIVLAMKEDDRGN